MRLTALGGLGEVGLNAMVFEHEGQRLLVDCGLMFPRADLPGVEVVYPDFTYLLAEPERLAAVVLTHAHEDHLGALPALLRRAPAPVWGTRYTLEVARHRLDEARLEPELRELSPREQVQVGPFTVEALRVTHSVPDAVALCLSAGGTTVVHSGDFKLDPDPIDGRRTDLERLAELGERGVDLLLSDSTNSEIEGHSQSERVVADTFARLFQAAPGRVVVSLFGSHLHRVQHTLDLAARLGRRVLLWGRTLERNVRLARAVGALAVADELLVDLETFLALPRERAVLICTGAQGEPRATLAGMLALEPRELRIEPGDTVIISSRTIPGNEPHVTELIDRIIARGARPIWPGIEPGVHVSGHAARDEQRRLIELVRPRQFVPVHGELHHLHGHAEVARAAGLADDRVVLASDGDLFALSAEGLQRLGRVPSGRCYGRRESEAYVSPQAIEQRRDLAHGALFAAVALAAGSGRVMAGPHLAGRGLPVDEEAMLPLAAEAARAGLLELSEVRRGDDALVTEVVVASVRRVFKQLSGRRPNVVVQVLRV